jgi:hypothetical protein
LLAHTLPGRHHDENKAGDTEPLDGSLQASKWFIGILEATDLKQLATFDLPRYIAEWELAEAFLRQDSSPTVLSEALSMPDFYDIAFFKILMAETIRRVAKKGHIYALSAFVMGVKIGDLEVSKFALGYMSDLPDPDEFDLPMTEAIGLPAFRILIQAYCSANKCESVQYKALIEYIEFH